MQAYCTDNDGGTYESWEDVSAEIGRQMDGFLQATPEQNAITVAEWANNGYTAIRDLVACGYDPQFSAWDYERWAGESELVFKIEEPISSVLVLTHFVPNPSAKQEERA